MRAPKGALFVFSKNLNNLTYGGGIPSKKNAWGMLFFLYKSKETSNVRQRLKPFRQKGRIKARIPGTGDPAFQGLQE